MKSCLLSCLQTCLQTCLQLVFQSMCTNSMHKSSDTCANSIDRSVHYSVSMLMRYVYSCTTAHEHVNKGAGRAREASMSRRTCRDVRATLDHPRGDARGQLQRASNIFERSLPRTCLDMCSPTYQETHAQACAQVRCTKRHRL